METIQQQIVALQVIVAQQQVSVKRQRFAILALTGIIVAGGFIAAVRPTGDATFDTITCKEWKVVDADGKVRIVAATFADGRAGVQWLDKDEKMRITAITFANGYAGVQWNDKDGKVRIGASTLADGGSTVDWLDKNEKLRIRVGTFANGTVVAGVNDIDGTMRIGASTFADGTVILPTKDLKPPKEP